MASTSSHLEVAITVSNADAIDVWDVQTGAQLKSFNVQADNMCMIDDTHFVLSQSDKATLQVWSWVQGSAKWKCSAAERMSCFAVSNDAVLLAAGAPSGKIYIWNVQTGELMRIWDAHFKKVTALRFSDEDSLLFSGGEDALVNAWLLAQVLAASDADAFTVSSSSSSSSGFSSSSSTVAPFIEWSAHALPVTGIYCGAGGISGRVATCSLDRTVRLWDVPANAQIASFILPVAAQAVVLDAAETFLYAAGADGRIFQIDLLATHAFTTSSTTTAYSVDTLTASSSHSSTASLPSNMRALTGHTKMVASLALSFDSATLVSASADGTCIVWDTRSGQAIRSLKKQQQRKGYHHVSVVLDGAGYFGVKGSHKDAAAAAAAQGRVAPVHLKKFVTGPPAVPRSVPLALPATSLSSRDLLAISSAHSSVDGDFETTSATGRLQDSEGDRATKKRRVMLPLVMAARAELEAQQHHLSSASDGTATSSSATRQNLKAHVSDAARSSSQRLYRAAAAALLVDSH